MDSGAKGQILVSRIVELLIKVNYRFDEYILKKVRAFKVKFYIWDQSSNGFGLMTITRRISAKIFVKKYTEI